MQKGKQRNAPICPYSATVAGFLILGLILIWAVPKTELFIRINALHSPFLDGFFKTITYLGDGWFSIVAGLLLILVKRKELGSMVLASYAISGLLAQLLKRYVTMPRPMAVIPGSTYPHFIPDYTLNAWNSFPSGHSASVFALTALLAWNSPVPQKRFLLAVAALLTGYSRIYLGNHFLDDVVSGALLGLLTSCGVMLFRNGNAKSGKPTAA
jgi:membrane-associated phospholipid phosphatase